MSLHYAMPFSSWKKSEDTAQGVALRTGGCDDQHSAGSSSPANRDCKLSLLLCFSLYDRSFFVLPPLCTLNNPVFTESPSAVWPALAQFLDFLFGRSRGGSLT